MSTSNSIVPESGVVRLCAENPALPSIDLAGFRRLSDRHQMMGPGDERARVRARIMAYLPALLDHLDELTATAGLAPAQHAATAAPRG